MLRTKYIVPLIRLQPEVDCARKIEQLHTERSRLKGCGDDDLHLQFLFHTDDIDYISDKPPLAGYTGMK